MRRDVSDLDIYTYLMVTAIFFKVVIWPVYWRFVEWAAAHRAKVLEKCESE